MPLGPIEPPWDQRLARALVRPLRHTRVTPNAITTIALALGLLSRIAVRDLRNIGRDRNLPEAVRSAAVRLHRVKSQ